MSARELLQVLRNEGVELKLDGDRIKLRATLAPIAPERLAEIRKHKAQLAATLAAEHSTDLSGTADTVTPWEHLTAIGTTHPGGFFGAYGPTAAEMLELAEAYEKAPIAKREALTQRFFALVAETPILDGERGARLPGGPITSEDVPGASRPSRFRGTRTPDSSVADSEGGLNPLAPIRGVDQCACCRGTTWWRMVGGSHRVCEEFHPPAAGLIKRDAGTDLEARWKAQYVQVLSNVPEGA